MLLPVSVFSLGESNHLLVSDAFIPLYQSQTQTFKSAKKKKGRSSQVTPRERPARPITQTGFQSGRVVTQAVHSLGEVVPPMTPTYKVENGGGVELIRPSEDAGRTVGSSK